MLIKNNFYASINLLGDDLPACKAYFTANYIVYTYLNKKKRLMRHFGLFYGKNPPMCGYANHNTHFGNILQYFQNHYTGVMDDEERRVFFLLFKTLREVEGCEDVKWGDPYFVVYNIGSLWRIHDEDKE